KLLGVVAGHALFEHLLGLGAEFLAINFEAFGRQLANHAIGLEPNADARGVLTAVRLSLGDGEEAVLWFFQQVLQATGNDVPVLFLDVFLGGHDDALSFAVGGQNDGVTGSRFARGVVALNWGPVRGGRGLLSES